MNYITYKKAGISLIVFTVLLVFTMLHHPSGGSIQHLSDIATMIVITHSVAILSLPFGWIGFWGLTLKLGTDKFGSVLAFAMISLGLIAVLLAGATNGLVFPIFMQHYKDASPETMTAIDPVLRYSLAVNHAFDYVYTVAIGLAVLCWSIVILVTRKLPVWIGWLGIAMAVFMAVPLMAGVAVNSVHGLRLFGTGLVVWLLVVGGALARRTA
jgi:hypothetical protein